MRRAAWYDVPAVGERRGLDAVGFAVGLSAAHGDLEQRSGGPQPREITADLARSNRAAFGREFPQARSE